MMNRSAVIDAARALLDNHAHESARLARIDAAMAPWTRQEVARRYNIPTLGTQAAERQLRIAKDSQALFLPLVLDTFAQSMKVDNYLASNHEQAPAWTHWQRNAMDAAQTGITRAAMQYGTSYAVVLPGQFGAPGLRDGGGSAPIITGASPRSMSCFYGEAIGWPQEASVTTEWPIMALEIKGRRLRLIDEEAVYYIGAKQEPSNPALWSDATWNHGLNFEFIEARPHGIGVTPVVRFRDRWLVDGERQSGIIEPLLSIQDRIDRTSFEMGIAQYFAAFKQRYVVGWMPDDEEDVLRMKASDTWFIDRKAGEVTVGQFDETDLTRYIESRKASIQDLAAIAQVPVQFLGAGSISNVSAEGLAAMEMAKDRKASEIQTSLGESYEQMLRLCAHIDGDEQGAADFAAEVKWRDQTARSFAQTVDGLGKLAQMLDIPAEMLWEDVPGYTAEKIRRIKAYAQAHPEPTADDEISNQPAFLG